MSTELNTMEAGQGNAATPAPVTFPARYAKFGVFQADWEREELFQGGKRVKVQAKLFQGLVLLISRAGQVVTREEVRRHLWPDTYLGNLDANVNTTLNKLRQVLGDSPETPLYIETVPRRGYCFVAGVEFSDALEIDEAPAEEAAERTAMVKVRELVIGSRESVQLFLRVAGLVLAGMVIGALLTFAWFFEQAKSQGHLPRAKVNAQLACPDSERCSV